MQDSNVISISFVLYPSVGQSQLSAMFLHCYFLYPHFPQSVFLYSTHKLFSDSNWGRFKQGLDVPEFHETIEAFEDYNQSVINKEGLALASQGCIVSIL